MLSERHIEIPNVTPDSLKYKVVSSQEQPKILMFLDGI